MNDIDLETEDLEQTIGDVERRQDLSHLWVVSYSDFMTILMIFFLMLFAHRVWSKKVSWEVKREAQMRAAQETQKGMVQRLARLTDVQVQAERVDIHLPSALLFESGQAELKPSAADLLAGISPELAAFKGEIVVEGHTDNLAVNSHGKFQSNWELSVGRAFSVINCLTTHGVDPQHLSARGYGPYRPRVANDTPEHRAENRRIEIILLNPPKGETVIPHARKIFFIVLAIVVIPVSMTCWKIVQYARVSKTQVYELHSHIAHTLALNTTSYFHQLNMRLAFAPVLARARIWSEQMSILNNALTSNSDFACVALLDSEGKEKVKAYDAQLSIFQPPLDYEWEPLLQKVKASGSADAGPVYEKMGVSFFDILYPLENGTYLLVAVRWESLKNLLFDQQVGEKGYIWLLDEFGRVIGDSHRDYVGQSYIDWPFFQAHLDNRDEWRGEFNDPRGVPSVGAAAWVKGAGWLILSAQPQSEAYAEAYSLRRSAFFWMVFSFTGMIWFGYFWVKEISMPITKLSVGVNNVTARRYDEKIPENFGLEEFRALGQAFNRMMKQVQSYEALQVEKIIEEHTTVQSLLFSIADGIIMLGGTGEVIFSNEPARKWAIDVAGRGKDFEYAWKSLQEYPPWMDAILPVIDNQKESTSEEFEFPVQGRPRWARVLAQQVLTEGGRRLGVMVVIRDVTQDKELDRMKEDFFNGITHDLRTPLAATIGYLGLSEIQVPESEKELGVLVGSARQSAKRALSLVETILSLARLQAGKLNLNMVPVQAQAIVQKIAHELHFQALSKKISISSDCEDSSLWVNADPSMIERVVENLAGNAIKYTMEGGWVVLRARAVEEGIEISIEDNGRGIPPEAISKLFGKFQQVKAEDRAVGFGIGLSFSKGIVEAHGSSIQVESEVGKGSKFYFILQRSAAPSQSVSAAA